MRKTGYLEQISSPADVKRLTQEQLKILCKEIRSFLIENVSKTGGHLSSNLGTVELTVALHKVFTTPQDKIVWDVGHQCYTHKILTGRRAEFIHLRQQNGLSGFPNPAESQHDAFIAGHGSTALSAAIGLAQGKRLRGEKGKVIAIIGDGAFTGGMVYEGMNNIRSLSNLIVILNDNKMSISKNVGSVAQYLTQLRTSPGYFKAKRDVQSVLDAVPLIGPPVRRGIQTVKSAFRRSLYHSTMFEEMGFQYAGPINGHDIGELCDLFSAYQYEQTAPMFFHILTVKGKGFEPAEKNPGEFHGVSAFDLDHITDPDVAPPSSFSTVFGEELAKLAQNDSSVCAITAAMKYGTGLQYFYKQHKNRFFDVGMAEEHAVTFSAGLAQAGMKPVVALYSTFLQRAYDQLIHDVSLQNANVLVAVDRAGLVPGDGATHQGIFDAALFSQIDNFKVVSPCNYAETRYWLKKLLSESGPKAIRYPRGEEESVLSDLPCTGNEYDLYHFGKESSLFAFVCYGAESAQVLQAAKQRVKNGEPSIDVLKLCVIHPISEDIADKLLAYKQIVFVEEGIMRGGIGEHLEHLLRKSGFAGTYQHIGLPSLGISHASVEQLRCQFGLDKDSLSKIERGIL
ncbi:1-deoxy-D-xylulose-5-phosphate synthase [uncultured Ruthenibacterium sp.]|uniref:1-deoxy-D-xylulose-5-phosphate synthase n=1 Tax=uncultured Ruthenibacterium sp. TaxID=1905347 RepID=UPI00349ECEB9